MSVEEHTDDYCPGDEWIGCDEGRIFGPCGEDTCYGSCEWWRGCKCVCHTRAES